jgi:UDP-N-acetylglucosamine acyltransferase
MSALTPQQEALAMSLTYTESELIHPTAVIGPEAELAPDVRVGPFAMIEGPVQVGPGCVVESHACLTGPLVMGRDNFVGHGALLGKSPQHRGDKGTNSRLVIGNGNVFREYVTVHRGTVEGGGETRIGDRNYLMINAHIGHDAKVGNGTTMVNGSMLAGHVQLHDGAILSACAAIQQRARVGRLAMLGGLGSSTKDIPPFVLAQGYNCITGLNVVGLRRAGISPEAIAALRDAYRIYYKEGRSRTGAIDRIESDLGQFPEVLEFTKFIGESVIGVNPARGTDRVQRTY